ncbi:helix-turn-helix domain-containing protein [Pseudonocardia alaniniphila]|uniref:Helix-turn-helix domain-containing protein n=1 Tax=Pseudonocardia alaniniphila TaxID=75291 RepID=A0ABS9TTN2_9PSEU|nr:helix-turn-helix domain-containing protein [Pseudonocardia alaniniphila]MCH6171920.1 helix-turn-helix domain-containing protein [Pseudonocardia alaniniphila]
MQIREYSGEEFEDVAGKIWVPMIARTGPDFSGLSAVHELSKTLTLSRSHFRAPASLVRTGQMAAKTSADDVMVFCVYMAGRGRVRQHDRLVELAVGTGILIEARRPYVRVSETETRCMNLRFCRDLLPLRTAEITEVCARSMNPAAPAMRLLCGYLGRLFEMADELTVAQRLDAGRAAIDLLAMTLRDVTPTVPGGDGPEGVLLDMMQTHVREHLAEPHLRVEELARRHYLSVRHVYTLFERIGTTPAAYLREQRLVAARAMLSDPRNSRLGTTDIAAAVGFLDRRTLERAFRQQYGMSPGDWRREHCHSGSASATFGQGMPHL